MNKDEITGIILAGGKSSRMGTDKGLLDFNGKKLVETAVGLLSQVCGNIIISANSTNYDFVGYPVVKDIYPNSGPMGGIYSALKESTTKHNLVLSCDMPLIKTALLADLLKVINDFEVIVPWHGDQKFEPMCAYYHKNVVAVFYEFIQQSNFKIPDTFEIVRTYKFEINSKLDYYTKELFFNVNSKNDLSHLNKKLS
ncbi:MAG: molybdenum cofactor guanylyltransferase [Bacteroidetes bacterium]|nr:molybdenum cofactor guanylyltransferase [Bacteroidota bacterium]